MPLYLISSKDRMFLRARWFLDLRVLACVLFVAGCMPAGPSTNRTDVDNHFMAIGGAYRAYATEHSDYPKTVEQIRGFLESKQGIWNKYSSSVDAFLVSPRDGKPMVLLAKADLGPVSPVGEPWVAYESVGVDGVKRLVDGRGFIEDKPAQEVEALFGANQE